MANDDIVIALRTSACLFCVASALKKTNRRERIADTRGEPLSLKPTKKPPNIQGLLFYS